MNELLLLLRDWEVKNNAHTRQAPDKTTLIYWLRTGRPVLRTSPNLPAPHNVGLTDLSIEYVEKYVHLTFSDYYLVTYQMDSTTALITLDEIDRILKA